MPITGGTSANIGITDGHIKSEIHIFVLILNKITSRAAIEKNELKKGL